MIDVLRAGALFLAVMWGAAHAGAQQPASPTPSPSPSPYPFPARPISESVDRVVERFLAQQAEPCLPATNQGLPCFPAEVEKQKPEESVAEALRRFKDDGTYPRLVLTPQGTPIVGVSFDPFCAAKSLGKAIRGKNDTYYLYRIWTREGERAILRDQPFMPGTYQAFPEVQYEYVAKIDGECEAVAAWRKAWREALDRNKERAGK
jgi:hypothetical protein